MITEDDAEKTLSWLVENARAAAKARGTRIYMEEYRKSLKSLLMASAPGESVAARETAAYAHPDYVKHLEALRTAVEDDERFRWLQTAAEAKIEMFRTGQANLRAQGKVTT